MEFDRSRPCSLKMFHAGDLLRCRCCDNRIIPTTVTYRVLWRLIGRHCGDDTQKSRSVIKFLHEWFLSELSFPVCWRMPSRVFPLLFFSLFVRHVRCSRLVRSVCCAWCAVPVCWCTTHVCLLCSNIWILTGQIVSECSEVWYASWVGESVILLHISRVRKSSRVIFHPHTWSLCLIIIYIIYTWNYT